jgi:hypothetical protein
MTGDPTPYSAADVASIAGFLGAAFQQYRATLADVDLKVKAKIEWSGDVARKAIRTTRLRGLDLAPVKAALDRYRAAGGAVDKARPAASYQAKGWQAQLRALTGHKYGSAAADRAGLSPSKGTLLSWLSETREPSKANQDRIAGAYEALRSRNVDKARDEHGRAGRDLTDALDAAIRDAPDIGVDVHFFNIDELDLE